jgi:hypothetical protein
VSTMTRKLLILGAVASLALPHFLQAQEISKPLASISAGSITAMVSCHGVANIPMTADAAQALPMQLVATLSCGEGLAVLSDAEGYTVKVRTVDGRTGWVAAMYVSKIPPPKPVPHYESAALQNGVARWQAGAKGCDQFVSDNEVVESVTVSGVTVQVSLHDTGWKLRADVAVANTGAERLYVNPAKFTLNEAAGWKSLPYRDPAQLAKTTTHQVLWTNASAGPHRTSPSVPSMMNVGYKMPADSTTSAPNYLVQHRYAEEEAIRAQSRQTLIDTARQINSLALKAGSVQANDKVAGAVWFERDKDLQHLVLSVPVGNQIFEFPFSFNNKK